ncbi:hypothetical protein [Pseudomonas fluorescens]|uniref:hypothetical protein n=1 Tax=Pseudomonas fluorescens TaxID=294 RepID=UPI00123F2B70|nr:hypothetical protein [Pseudomonas fluorescens]
MRIRGTIGEWPVDLTIELEPAEWAQLGRQVELAAPVEKPLSAPVVRQSDDQYQAAREALRVAGQMTGPELLEHLEQLTGSTAAGKRLLVRLRHSAEVRVESAGDAPVYHWIG